MLSISARGGAASAAQYYDHLADEHRRGGPEDYYTNSHDQPGQWHGAGAKALGLHGAVSREDFGHALRGRSPDGRDLVQGAGDQHRAGWDLTFSAPKSVSLAWAMGDEGQRQAIQQAHNLAVKAALDHVQEHCLVARRGKGGTEREPASMVAAVFQHGTSREQDPQLHSHAFVHNLAQRADGSWGAIESHDLYSWKMASGAIYRAELAAQMQNLGYQIEPDRDAFRLAAVPRQAEAEFSTRRSQILEALQQHGASGAKASEVAALDTRRGKEHIDQASLIQGWHAAGVAIGFGPEQAAAARQAEPVQGEPISRTDLLKALTSQESTLREQDLYRAVAVAAQGRHGADWFRQTVNDLTKSGELVRVRHRETQEIMWTTREMQTIERGMLDTSTKLAARDTHRLDAVVVDQALARFQAEKGFALSDEQTHAVRHITQGGGFAQVQGGAGTGKSTLATAARMAWEAQGLTVRGCAQAGKAAAGLQAEAGIQSQTIASLLRGIEMGSDSLDAKTVLMVDEAGMIGSRQMARLLEAADKAGAKVVLIGDSRQLQAVDAGGAFKALQQQHGAAMLDEIRRQKDADMKAAVEHLSRGEVRDAMRIFLDRGMVHVKDDKQQAMQTCVAEWAARYDRARPGETILMANTRAEVAQLNTLAREWMKQNHQLGPATVVQTLDREGKPVGRIEVAEGDRVRFTKNNNHLGVMNGEFATIKRVEMDKKGQTWISAEVDGGRSERFSPDVADPKQGGYSNLIHGYATTTHSAQGVTANHAIALLGGLMQTLEATYVQLSRMRFSTQIITTRQALQDQAAAHGIDLPLDDPDRDPLDDLKDLIEQMETSRQKGTTLDFENDEPEQEPEQVQEAGPILADTHKAPEVCETNFLELAQKMAWANTPAEARATLQEILAAPVGPASSEPEPPLAAPGSGAAKPTHSSPASAPAAPAPAPVLDSGPELE